MNERVLPIREVQKITSLGKTAIYGRIKTGDFPRPIKIAANRNGWLMSEIQAWIEEQRRKRDEGEGKAA